MLDNESTPQQPNLESMSNAFEPDSLQKKWEKIWGQGAYFLAGYRGTGCSKADAPAFSIQLPPPNVTGTLHMGHAFNQTIMDSLTRYHRMKGANTVWVPGSDHAGIATQIVVERQLEKTKETRHDLGRENFLKRVWAWKEQSGSTITEQMRRMGDSVDWSREYFTMDDNLSKTVTETFVRLYEQGLIYRGKRLVNWDPILQSAVSDLEVENTEEDGSLWHIRYQLADGSGSLVVATTRPETMLGDAALMVHPDDERYQHVIGKMVSLPLCDRKIPVIADSYVDKEFGTGVVKVTPAHDNNDYQVGQRHGLPQLCILTLDAKINEHAPKNYQGLDRFVARKRIVSDLDSSGFLVEIKKHKLMIPRCTRTGQIIEPMLTDQWFVAMTKVPDNDRNGKSIAQKAIDAVADGAIQFVPGNWVNTYNQWMNNIQDWCISRQLWWGHQIPAWYDDEGHVYVARNEAEAMVQAKGRALRRDEDVLDTWYSSAIVPFSTLGWPTETEDIARYLPSSVLVTGYDIIFFWVARMIMMTMHFTEKVPFHHVYIHGLVLDAQGKKMSKSDGNVLDPVDLIDGIDIATLLEKRTIGLRKPENAPKVRKQTEKEFPNGIPAYGADALRFTFASLATLGRSINFDSKRCEGYRNFCNKLWNASRFVLMNCEGFDCGGQSELADLPCSAQDLWITSTLQRVVQDVEEAFTTYRIDNAANAIYQFIWDEFCDWYLEIAKVQIHQGDAGQQRATRATLTRTLEVLLRLAHPIIPFITEELWVIIAPISGVLPIESGIASICIANYPYYDERLINEAALAHTEKLKLLVNACRNLRGEMNVSPASKLPLLVAVESNKEELFLEEITPVFKALAKLTEVKIFNTITAWELAIGAAPIAVVGDLRMCLFMQIDIKVEMARLEKESTRLQTEISKASSKLLNEAFLAKAPPAVIEQEKNRLQEFSITMEKINDQITRLK
jgi:valyl-tRNA synthetase